MRNNLIVIFFFFFIKNFLHADDFIFESKSLEIFKENNLVLAKDATAFLKNEDLKIKANNLEYFKDQKILNAYGNGQISENNKNLLIEFENSIINQNTSTVEFLDQFKIKNNKDRSLLIVSKKTFYNRKNKTLSSYSKSKLIDDFGNQYFVDNFKYELDKNILKLNNLEFKDKKNNIFKTDIAFVNTKSNKLYAKDIQISLNEDSQERVNGRIKGKSLINTDNYTAIKKGVFTTCKKRDGCPPWQISSKEILRDKKKKTMYYKNALLKIYDIPILYFPNFFHPDPSVKRASGFLVPRINSSRIQPSYLSTPYFLALSENKDATFSPRFYNNDDKFLFQTEFRQKNFTSAHQLDFSFLKDTKNLDNHIFYNYKNNVKIQNFEEAKINFMLQNISNNSYLKKYKIKSDLNNQDDLLENTFNLNLNSASTSVNFQTSVFEDLNQKGDKKYEYILPRINIIKNFENQELLDGKFTLSSDNLLTNYNSNIYEGSNVNKFEFTSTKKITNKGFLNNYEFLIKNSNTDAQNSENLKNKENLKLSGIIQLNTEYPLIKQNNHFNNVLLPRVSLKLSPNYTANQSNEDLKIDNNNIFDIKRFDNNLSNEGGSSLIYGLNYSIADKKNKELFDIKISNNLRIEENDDLPKINQLNEKTSNFFNEISLSPTNFLSMKYSNSIKNNFKEKVYENLSTIITINKIVTKFDYINDNNLINENSFLSSSVEYFANESNSFSYSKRENKSTNLIEFYKLIYQYKNDCLAASIEYNNEFYNDENVEPDKNIIFKLTFIPFE
ncbi:hypothetical protein OAT25_00065 [Candidatus Pelagibacter sp.]|nr:hypothetical protein [Candidatus Pelagibacter sp.]